MIPRAQDLVVTRWSARYRGQVYPCAVGRNGIGVKTAEGDGLTPVGRWRIAELRFRADRRLVPGGMLPAKAIGPGDIWSDDPADPLYNLQSRNIRPVYRHERLCRGDPLYDLFAILDFNWPNPVAGAGSAIFLHAWRKPRHPTAGCIAFAPEVLRHVLESWEQGARVIVRA